MHIIKLNAIDSTNAYLKTLVSGNIVEDYTVVVAKHQTEGRGQMGTEWYVEDGKNLTCSVLTHMKGFAIDDSFYISMITSLAIVKTLQGFNIPKLHVKWPNDILAEEKKICGILIENIIKSTAIDSSIIGFGLNVNQTQFEGLPNASSLKIITGKLYSLDEILLNIVTQMKHYFQVYNKGNLQEIKSAYESLLFRKDKPSTFKTKEGDMFPGFIKGVDASGHLQVLLEDDVLKTFAMKEIQLLY